MIEELERRGEERGGQKRRQEERRRDGMGWEERISVEVDKVDDV